METTGKGVDWTANAALMLSDIYVYIESQSGTFVASEYLGELIEFGNHLATKSEHFSYCRNIKLQTRGYRCALFKKRYVLIYKENEVSVTILAIIHAKRSPQEFEKI